MAMSKAEYESAVGRPLTDAEYAKLAGAPPLHAKFDAAPPPWAPSHAAPVPLPPPAPDPMLMIAPKPSASPPPPTPQPMPSFEAAKKGGLAAFVKAPQAFDAPGAGTAPVEIAPQIISAPKPAPKPSSGGHGGGPSAPKAPPVDPTTFGMVEHEKAADKQAVKHMGAVGGFQQEMSAVDAEQADAFEGIAQGVASKYELEAQKAEKAAMRRKAFLTEYNNTTNQKIEEYANAKVDPARYWHDKGTGGTVLAAIGIALGGWAQGMAAGAGKSIENGGLQMIEQGIARDIENQKAEIARKGAGVEARKGLYTQYLQQFGDEQTADQMAMETYLRHAKAEIDVQAAKTASKQVKTNAAALKEAIDDKIIQFQNGRAATGERLYNDYLARQQAQAQAAAAGAAAEMKKRNEAIFKAQIDVGTEHAKKIGGTVLPLQSPMQLPSGAVIPAGSVVVLDAKGNIDMQGTEATQKVATVNLPVLQPGGGVAYAPTQVQKDGYGKASEKAAGATNAIKAIEQMEAAAKMPGTWTGEKKKLYEQAISNYTTAYGVANGMGALSGPDLEIVKATIPDVPTYGVGYLSDAQLAQLANQKKMLADQAKAAVQVYGTPETAGPAPLTSVGAPQ
jgi:hypothetical protein